MTNVYIKKYWEEEDVLFYLHFINNIAIRQIEITPTETRRMSLDVKQKLIYMISLWMNLTLRRMIILVK